MTTKQQLYWIYALSALFIGANLFLIYHDFYLGLALPLLGAVILLGVFRLDITFMLIAFTTPLAINTETLDFGLGVSLPSEPLMAGTMLIFLIRQFRETTISSNVFKHPVTIAIAVNLVWIFLTTISSTMMEVSFKFFTARLWFIVSCYLLAIEVFKEPKNLRKFIWLHTIPICLVIGYTMFRLISFGVDKQHAHWVMGPFYKDHAIYGACIAMVIPFFVGFLLMKNRTRTYQLMTAAVLIILVVGEVFSYARAAWLSLIGAGAVFIIMWLKIKFKYLVAIGVLIGAVGYMSLEQIIINLERNKTDSATDFADHVQSMSNIATDDSNLERLNRWNCALKMFKEKPFLGHGPGTYSFTYASYQQPEDLTLISTNFGDQGNAHSEFLGRLSEQGVLGSLAFIILLIVVLYKGITLYYRLEDKELKMFVMCSLIGLISYYIHGVLNNYLDQDKAAMPFWALTAIIVAIDVHHGSMIKKREEDALLE